MIDKTPRNDDGTSEFSSVKNGGLVKGMVKRKTLYYHVFQFALLNRKTRNLPTHQQFIFL